MLFLICPLFHCLQNKNYRLFSLFYNNKPTKASFSLNGSWKLIERLVSQGYSNYSTNIVTQNSIDCHTNKTPNSLKRKHTLNVFFLPKSGYIFLFRLIQYSLASFISCASHLVSISYAKQK